MSHNEYYSNTDNLTFPNNFSGELTSIKQDLESLSGDALDVYLKYWTEKLLTDVTETSLILTVFEEVRRKIVSTTPAKDRLLCLDFLAQQKQTLFACDIFLMMKISTQIISKNFTFFLDAVPTILKMLFCKNMQREKQNIINRYAQF